MLPAFLIGIYGAFDQEKHMRELRPHFWGSEVCCLPDAETAKTVANMLKRQGLGFGVHFPLIKNRYAAIGLHPQLTSRDRAIREAAFQAVEMEADAVANLGAAYLLLHYPKPSLLTLGADWSDWRFPQAGEAIPADAAAVAAEQDLGWEAFARLAQISNQCGLKLVIEHDILHRLHYSELLPKLYTAHPNLGFCLDTGRAHLLEQTIPDFSALRFIKLMRPFITNVHLWTVQVGNNKAGGHYPVLPELRPQDGWGDVAAWLTALREVPEAYVLFEHRAELVSPSQLEACYRWTEQMLRPFESAT